MNLEDKVENRGRKRIELNDYANKVQNKIKELERRIQEEKDKEHE